MAPLYPHDVLIRWAVQHGGYFHDDVEVVHTPEKGYHLVVRRNATLQPNTQVLTCPMPCTMSILNVIDEGGFICRGIKIPPAFVQKQPRETVERFFLMEHYLVGKKSWWAPYIATLPTPDEVRRMQFQPDDLTWIRGTNLASAFETQTEQWKAHYEQGMEQLLKLNWQNARSGKLTWDLYRWAATIFTSRSFTSDVMSDTLAYAKATPLGRYSKSKTGNFRGGIFGGTGEEHNAQLTNLFSEKFAVLIPVLDILNYRPLAQVEWQARCFHVGLEVLEAVESGGEVHNNYGPRDNETLLLGYGFAIPNNPFDHFSVGLRLPKGLSLAEFRTPTNGGTSYNIVPLKQQDTELKCYVFKAEHPEAAKGHKNCLETALFSLDLLDAISLLRATDREWQAMRNFRKTYFAEGLEGRFEDSRNLLATMSQLLIECTVRLKALQNKSSLTPINLKQICARIYRESQVDILQNAVFLCRFVLRRAVEADHEEFRGDDLQMMRSLAVRYSFHSDRLNRLETLLQKHRCMSMENELLGFESMQTHMSRTLAALLCGVMTELGKERRLKQSMVELTAHDLAKIQISLTLSALLAESVGNNLKPRFKSWLDQLMQWYPPDDPNWHYVPDRGPTSPADAPPPLLLDLLDNASELVRKHNPKESLAWLQPKMIAWGWNVMEEEGVDLPMEVLDDRSTDPKEMAFLMYIPQIADRSASQD